MAVTSFIPEIWNASLELSFIEQAVAANLVNRSYEGDARKGNTVKINFAQRVQVTDYKSAGRTTSATEVNSTSIDLLIDQEKAFDFYVDDIDRAQAAGSMDAYTRSAGEALAEDADKFILGLAAGAAGVPVLNGDFSDAAGAWDAIRDARKTLNKAKVPQGQRVLVVNAEFEALLLGNDAKLAAADTSGSPAGLREATLGRILGFTVVTSENLPVTATPYAIGFYQPSIAYVSQIQSTEAMRAHDRFADRLRGLHVYGGKVVRPEGCVVINPSAA